uniref:Uncharacterized protein n=1 Tax=Octopus bimaculoides TaxID=37653 RepID=A0A0L8GS98_OCTBM
MRWKRKKENSWELICRCTCRHEQILFVFVSRGGSREQVFTKSRYAVATCVRNNSEI